MRCSYKTREIALLESTDDLPSMLKLLTGALFLVPPPESEQVFFTSGYFVTKKRSLPSDVYG